MHAVVFHALNVDPEQLSVVTVRVRVPPVKGRTHAAVSIDVDVVHTGEHVPVQDP